MYIFTQCNMLIILLVCITPRIGSSEPLGVGCDRFVYEYKLMERLIMLEQENKLLKARLETLEDSIKQPSIAVKVRRSSNQNLGSNSRVMYDAVISNIGNAYDLENGQFVAPVSGIYLVIVHACLGAPGQWMDLDILMNGVAVGRVFSGDSNYHSCGAESLSMHLDQGSRVWVVRVAGTATMISQDRGWNSFTAVLVQQDV